MKYSQTMLNKGAVTKIVVRYKEQSYYYSYVGGISLLWGLIKIKPYVKGFFDQSSVEEFFSPDTNYLLEDGIIYHKPYCTVFIGNIREEFVFDTPSALDAFLDQFEMNLIKY